ncbi:uncharacterized protein LOC132202019 isoform X2 [Neocloeon triangulifer]|uniref:uncharacterized protein LOC132202019 isoform X2 n=1 Tax=Neocloeon triangulifer TaxID=2078957 RepID=UPI00286F63D0|nr:uncharacterized protein LOC132202019 isoform X2 [Neocloeon triangulifer]
MKIHLQWFGRQRYFCSLGPIFRYLGERKKGADSKILAACGTLILAIGLAASSVAPNTELRMLTFGFIGGIGCSLVVTQCETQSHLHFRPSVSLCFSSVSQSLGHFAAPLIMMALVSKYGKVGAPLNQAAVALHGLIGALLLRKRSVKSQWKPPPMTENGEEEEVIYSRVPTSPKLVMRSWKNPASDPLDNTESGDVFLETEDFEEEDINFDVLNDGRPRNHMGVEILPQILEEDEEEDVILDVTQKRFSKFRMSLNRDSWLPMPPLEHYSSEQQDSTVGGNSPMLLLTPSSIPEARVKTFTFERPSCCSKFAEEFWIAWKKILHFCKSISYIALVPTVLINLAQKLAQLGVLAVLPAVANDVVRYRRHEGAFSMAIVGFGWLCTTICTPCFLLPSAKRQSGIIFSILYFISSLGFALLSDPRSHDRLTLGCVIIGMSHGALLSTIPSIHHTLWGSASVKSSVQNFVDILTAALITPCVAATFLCVDSIQDFKNVFLCLCFLQASMGAGTLLWTLMRRIFHKYQSWELQRQSFIL